jgi:hypothetical protein
MSRRDLDRAWKAGGSLREPWEPEVARGTGESRRSRKKPGVASGAGRRQKEPGTAGVSQRELKELQEEGESLRELIELAGGGDY